MAGNARIADYASAGGKAKAARRLTLARVTEELGSLDTPQDVKRWAQTAFRWASSQMMPGATATACAALLREWRGAHDSAATFEVIEELRATVRTLQAERDAAVREVERLQRLGASREPAGVV